MCISQKQIELYEKVLTDISIETETIDYQDGDVRQITVASLPYRNADVIINDEKGRAPYAVKCMQHEFCSGACEEMQAVNYYYEKIASIFAQDCEEEKPQTVRNVIASQNNRVEYQVLGSCKKHYHTVQMVNGRASNCVDQVGAICMHRVYHPAVPCSHMQTANAAEENTRTQARIDSMMQQEPFASMPDDMQQIAREELTKCNEAYQSVMRQPVGVEVGHPDYWNLLKKREKKAKKAYRDQYFNSLEVLKQIALPIAA